jgi:hypothetical protein
VKRGANRIEVGAEIMNILQEEAFLNIVTQNFFAPNFGQSSGSWIEPRRMNLMVRVAF